MDTSLRTRNGKNYIDLTGGDVSIGNESELNDLIALCYYHDSNFILLGEKNLSEEFFNLKSGLAGAAMQKFSNYQAKVAVLLPTGSEQNQRFKELMYEMSGSNHFRFYDNHEEAVDWLTA